MRAALAVALTLIFAPGAGASWPDPQLGPDVDVTSTDGGLAADGTPVVGWSGGDGTFLRIGSAAPQRLSDEIYANIDVLVGGDQVAMTWYTNISGGPSKVVTGSVAGGVGTPTTLPGTVTTAAMNRSGDLAALLLLDATKSTLVWRPADGTFSAPVAAPAPPYTASLTVGPTGEAMIGWIDQTSPMVASSMQGGAFTAPVALPTPKQTVGGFMTPQLALDAHGRAIAAWAGSVQASSSYHYDAPSLAVRDGGTWQSLPDVPLDLGVPVVGTGDDGQALLAWWGSDLDYHAVEVSLADRSVGRRTDFALAYRPLLGASPQDFHGTVMVPELAVAADGTASITWGQDRDVLVAKRASTSAFGAPVVAGCQLLFQVFPKSLGLDAQDRAGVLFDAYPKGGLAVAREETGDGPVRSCPAAEPGSLQTFQPTLTTSPSPVLVGKPARLTLTNTRAPNSLGASPAYWSENGFGLGAADDSIDVTFFQPGRHSLSVWSGQYYEGIGPTPVGRFQHVDVYVPATLTAKPRQHRRIRLRASALTYGPEVQARLVIRRKGKVRRRITGPLGLTAKRIDLPAHTRGAYRIELRQDGKVQKKVSVRVT